MNYNFSFDKKTIALLLGGLAFVGTLLFVAGLLVGTNWKAEQPAVAAAAPAGQPPPAAAPAPAPAEPVVNAPAARPEHETSDQTAEADAAPSPAQQAHGVAGNTKGAVRAQLYDGDGEMKIVERAQPSATRADGPNQSSFSVQVGVFVDEKDANRLVGQLRNKGYAPFVLATNDDESRTWYAVRIGTYTDRTEATRAASNIATQENIKTFVRPFGSL